MIKLYAPILFLLCSCFIAMPSYAQNPALDQYQNLLNKAQADMVKEYQRQLATVPNDAPFVTGGGGGPASTESGVPDVGTSTTGRDGPRNVPNSQQNEAAQSNPWLKPNPWAESAKHNEWAQPPAAPPPDTTTLSPAPAPVVTPTVPANAPATNFENPPSPQALPPPPAMVIPPSSAPAVAPSAPAPAPVPAPPSQGPSNIYLPPRS